MGTRVTRIDNSERSMRCWRSDHNQARLINAARELAHAKHGDNSIEAVGDDRDFLVILVEEIGEVSHAMTYDGAPDGDGAQRLADELVDVLAVAGAWLDKLRLQGVEPGISSKVWTV